MGGDTSLRMVTAWILYAREKFDKADYIFYTQQC